MPTVAHSVYVYGYVVKLPQKLQLIKDLSRQLLLLVLLLLVYSVTL